MSQKACLPVGRRRKRGNNNGNGGADEVEPSFDKIESIDATEYLRLVVNQASRLPDVFMADDDDDGGHDENGNHHADHHHDQFDDGEEEGYNDDESMGRVVGQEGNYPKVTAKRAKATINTSNNGKINKMGSAAALEYLVSAQTELLSPPTANHVPPTGRLWADRTLDAFSRLRLYLEQTTPATPVERTIALPPLKDRAGWHVFCVGKQEAEGNTGSYFGDDDDDDSGDRNGNGNGAIANDNDNDEQMGENGALPDGENNKLGDNKQEDDDSDEELEEVPAWKLGLQATADGHYWPTTHLLLQMDQVMIRRVISHLTYFVCEGWSATHFHSAWLYALAARLDRSVHRDDAVVLYRLLKRLTVVRAQVDIAETATTTTMQQQQQQQNKDNMALLARLNTLILVYGVYFEQGGGYAVLMEPKS